MDTSDGILATKSVPDSLASAARALAPRLLLQFGEYRWLMAGVDLLVVNGALLAALSLRSGFGMRWWILTGHPQWFVLMGALWLLLAHAFDAYELGVADRFRPSVWAATKAGGVAVLVYFVIPYATPPLLSSPVTLVGFPLLVVAGLFGDRAACALLLHLLKSARQHHIYLPPLFPR